MKFYAQCYEDVILSYLLENVKESIFYIDVGANDPTELSVTKHFYELGGSGINIEPSIRYFEKLKGERKRDININCAVSNKDGFLEVAVSEEETYYNSEFSYFENAKIVNQKKIRCVTLTSICDENVSSKQEIHFLKVDVDGYEKECLEGMDFQKYRPWVLCIEVSVSDSWLHLLYDANYKVLYRDKLNIYLAAEEVMEKGIIPRCLRNDLKDYLCKRYDIRTDTTVEVSQEYKLQTILLALNQMLLLKKEEKSLVSYFEKQKYYRVAIYGMSYLGERLYDELKDSGVKVIYAIDQNAKNLNSEIEILLPDDELKSVDVVVVTAVCFYGDIYTMIKDKVNCPIISLEDIIYHL